MLKIKNMCSKKLKVPVVLLALTFLFVSFSPLMLHAKEEKTTVRIAYNNYFKKSFGPADPPIEAIKKEVSKKYPNIEVELNVTPLALGKMHNQLVTWFMSEDSTVDILGVHPVWMAEFGEAGWLLPLEDRIDKELLDSLNQSYLESHTYNGELLGLGPWWGGIGGLYYRKDLLNEYGFEPPETYSELVEIAETILKDRPNLTGWTWPAMNDQVLVNRWGEFLRGFGGEYFNEDGRCALNSDDGVEALEFMNSLIEDGITPRQVTNWKEADSQVRFINGDAIFHTGRQDLFLTLDNPEKSEVVDKWGFIPNPSQPDGASTGFYEGWAFGINRYTDVPEAATKVLEVMFSLPVQKTFALSQGPIQAHKGVYEDPDVLKHNPKLDQVLEVAKTAQPPFRSPNYPQISDILREEIHASLSGLRSSEKALDDACSRIDRMTE